MLLLDVELEGEGLLKALRRAARVVNKGASLPILSGVALIPSESGKHCRLRATDLELALCCTIPARFEGESSAQPGVVVEFQALRDFLEKRLTRNKSATVRFRTEGKRDGSSWDGHCDVWGALGPKGQETKLHTEKIWGAEDFPSWPKTGRIVQWPAPSWQTLKRALVCVPKRDPRKILLGVYCEAWDDQAHVSGCNGKTLYMERWTSQGGPRFKERKDFIMPMAMAEILVAEKAETQAFYVTQHPEGKDRRFQRVVAAYDGGMLSAPLLDMQYANIHDVADLEDERVPLARYDKKELTDIVADLYTSASRNRMGYLMFMPDRIEAPDWEGSVQVAAPGLVEGQMMAINAKNLMDVLARMEGKGEILFSVKKLQERGFIRQLIVFTTADRPLELWGVMPVNYAEEKNAPMPKEYIDQQEAEENDDDTDD